MAKIDIIKEIEQEIEGLRWLVKQWFIPNSCIMSTALMCQLLEGHGLIGFPLSCVVMVMNEIASNYIEDRFTLGADNDQAMRDLANLPGAYIVGIGLSGIPRPRRLRLDVANNKWVGHLVTIAIDPKRNKKWLIDLTIDQADRPEHGIICQPYITAIDNDMLGSSFTIDSNIDGINTRILYDPQWGDMTYQATADWQNAAGELGRVCTIGLMGYLLQMSALRHQSNPDRQQALDSTSRATKAAIRFLQPLARFDPAQVMTNKGGK